MRRVGGVTYINCGDWVDSCTAIVEHAANQEVQAIKQLSALHRMADFSHTVWWALFFAAYLRPVTCFNPESNCSS
jgi:hypothetical protein